MHTTEKKGTTSCTEEMKSGPSCPTDKTKCETSVFKRTYWRTPEMEMEECWDTVDPRKCYTVMKKTGETPFMMPGMMTGMPMTSMMGTMETGCCDKWDPMGDGMDEKFDRLCMMTGQRSKEMRDLIMKHKEMSVGQLFDKMCEMKMCC